MWTTVLVPVILIPLALMTIGLGFLLALANGVFRDIAKGEEAIKICRLL